MDTTIIMYLSITAVVVGLLTFFVTKLLISKKTESEDNSDRISKEEVQSQIDQVKTEALRQTESLRQEYEEQTRKSRETIATTQKALDDAQKEIADLEKQLDDSLNSSSDEKVKAKIEEVKVLKKKMETLEKELDDAENSHNKIEEQFKKSLEEYQGLQTEYDKLKEVSAQQKEDSDNAQKKLKQKIEDLEDDLEEAEDDRDKFEKQFRRTREEFTELQTEHEQFKAESKKLKEELESVRKNLEEKEKALNLKVESLEFIQEVLSAPLSSDRDVRELHDRVNKVVNFLAEDLKISLSKHFNIEGELKSALNEDAQKWAVQEKKSWIKHKTTIAFIGEFSAGKTSIVNRILSQDDPYVPLLPVSTKATTAIPTYISGGVSTRYEFVTPSDELKKISENTFKRVSKEVLDQVKGVSSLIQYFVMTYKNPNLNNLSILDTPGFNSNDAEDAERTISVINECDALFWVFDVNAGTVNRSSIDLIQKHLQKPLFIVINKVDTKAESEVNKVQDLISRTLQNAGIRVKGYIRFSSKANLNDIMKPIRSVQHDTSSDDFISIITGQVEDCVDKVEQAVQESDQTFNEVSNECNKLVDKYNNAIQNMYHDCETASNIPHFETYWYKKDRYEMEESEYNQLINVLNKICQEDSDALCDLYNQQMEKQREQQQAYSNFYEMKEYFSEMDEKRSQLKRLLKNL